MVFKNRGLKIDDFIIDALKSRFLKTDALKSMDFTIECLKLMNF